MFASPTYHQMAVQLIQKILQEGRGIVSERKKVIVHARPIRKGDVMLFCVYQGIAGEEVSALDPTYEGFADKAAVEYVNAVGVIESIGDAINFFRAQRKQGQPIEVVVKDNSGNTTTVTTPV